MVAPFVLDEPINRHAFEVYVERVVVPGLRPGDVVIMDNLSSHKGARTRELIEAAGASLLYLPPYSPDFNPIENAFSKRGGFPMPVRNTHAQSLPARRPAEASRHVG